MKWEVTFIFADGFRRWERVNWDFPPTRLSRGTHRLDCIGVDVHKGQVYYAERSPKDMRQFVWNEELDKVDTDKVRWDFERGLIPREPNPGFTPEQVSGEEIASD